MTEAKAAEKVADVTTELIWWPVILALAAGMALGAVLFYVAFTREVADAEPIEDRADA